MNEFKAGDSIYRIRYGELESGVVTLVSPSLYYVKWGDFDATYQMPKGGAFYHTPAEAYAATIASLNEEIAALTTRRNRLSKIVEGL